MFKNATLYRLGPDWSATPPQLEEALQTLRFVPCGASQPLAIGWVEPRGVEHAPLLEAVGGQWLLKLMIESKLLPSGVVKRKIDEVARKIEAETGRKPGRRQVKELKDEVVQTLLPMAFTKQAAVRVWIDPKSGLLLVDTASQTRADEVVSFLAKTLDGLPMTLLQTAVSPATAMSEWLVSREAPAGFSVDRECELQSSDGEKSVVKYSRHTLDIDEVRDHVAAGKLPTKLAMTWAGRVSFVLTDSMQVRKIGLLDGVFEHDTAKGDDRFDADVAIATGEMSRFIPDLIDALGGEPVAIGANTSASAPQVPTALAA